MALVSEFKGEGEYVNRSSTITHLPKGDGVYVFYMSNGVIVAVALYQNSLRYAEDAAENYCLGILNF